jgi:TonB-like protein
VNKVGIVQALTVISGPDILSPAALEAVQPWRFKPHYESGEAVPTETRITVTLLFPRFDLRTANRAASDGF